MNSWIQVTNEFQSVKLRWKSVWKCCDQLHSFFKTFFKISLYLAGFFLISSQQVLMKQSYLPPSSFGSIPGHNPSIIARDAEKRRTVSCFFRSSNSVFVHFVPLFFPESGLFVHIFCWPHFFCPHFLVNQEKLFSGYITAPLTNNNSKVVCSEPNSLPQTW